MTEKEVNLGELGGNGEVVLEDGEIRLVASTLTENDLVELLGEDRVREITEELAEMDIEQSDQPVEDER
jgi:hypothetical protein